MRSALLAIAVVSGGFGGFAGATTDCPGASACGATRLPAPILISAGRASYRIGRDGRLTRTVAARSAFSAHSAWFPGTATWYMIRHRRLLVGRGRTTLWSSDGPIAPAWLGVIAAGPEAVAFQMHHRLYIARYGRSARAVADRELPLGWTTGGLYTYSYPRRELLLRREDGSVVEVVARRPREYEFDLVTRTLYFVGGRMVGGAHGARTWRLGSLRGLGLSADTWLVPVGRLVELEDEQRLVILRGRSGAEFASTSLPRLGRSVGSPDSSLVISPDGITIAFSAPFGQSNVREVVYLLRAGARAAIAIHTEGGLHRICTQWADLAWHGGWLLYSDTEGRLAAIETADPSDAIELSGLVHRLLGSPDGFDAGWGR